MALYQTREPRIDFFEKARLGRRFLFSSDVTVTYDTRSGSMLDSFFLSQFFRTLLQIYLNFSSILLGYGVVNGEITQRTPVRGKSTTLKVKSDNGYWFTVTRQRGGGMDKHPP